MIVVTGAARTGTSWVMQLLQELGIKTPCPKFCSVNERVPYCNPKGYYEFPPELIKDGIQHHEYRGQAVKIFGHLLLKTPQAYVSKVIICTRCIEQSVPSYRFVYKEATGNDMPVTTAKYAFYSNYYCIYKYVAARDYIEVPFDEPELKKKSRIAEYIGLA